jgi:hypothetical protein
MLADGLPTAASFADFTQDWPLVSQLNTTQAMNMDQLNT